MIHSFLILPLDGSEDRFTLGHKFWYIPGCW